VCKKHDERIHLQVSNFSIQLQENIMNFRKTVLTTAIAASALATMQQASAWLPTWPLPAAAVQIWHGGATASTSSVQAAVCNAVCDPASPVDVFEDDRTAGKPDFWFIACKGKTGTGSLAGKDIIWNKRDEGGSGVGVGPVKLPKAIGFMLPSTGLGTNFPAAGVAGTCGTLAATRYKSTGFAVPAVPACTTPAGTAATADAVCIAPNIGTSDIEPEKFTTAFLENVPATDFDLDGTRGPTDVDDKLPAFDATGMTIAGLGQLTFNTPVSLRMYLDLQAAQFPTGHPLHDTCHPDGALYGNITAAVNDAFGMPTAGGVLDPRNNANSEDCMPNLQASEIRSIFMKTGAIRKRADMQYETSYGGGSFAEVSTITTRTETEADIQICRRVNGSGTQAQANAMITGYPCDPNGDGSIDTLLPEKEDPFATPFVSENESSGDVEKCLNDFNDGTNTSTKNSGLKKRWAIGVQSLEKNPPGATSYTNKYRFIKIDGFAPSLVNVHAGDYFDVGRQTLQYKTAGATAETIDAFTALVPKLSDPVALAGLNKVQAFCTTQGAVLGTTKCAGWLAAPKADDVATTYSEAPTSELDFTAPVSWFQRVSSSGSLPNTCAQPSAFKKSATDDTGVDITVGPATGQGSDENTDGDQNFYTGTP
jgi:hypothetical protein